MAGTLYSHASASFCCPHRVKEQEAAEKTPQPASFTAANLTLNAHLQINSCGYGKNQVKEREATKL